MKQITSSLIVILFIIILILLVVRSTSILEAMTNIYQSVVIPENCYEYLVTDGIFYYLIAPRRKYDGVYNPLKFKSLVSANRYLMENKCSPLPLINLVVSKNKEDPTDSYEKICSREVAVNRFNADVCSNYADLNNNSEEAVEARLQAIREDIDRNFDNYSIEECMIKKVGMDDTELTNPYNPSDENLQKFIKLFGQANDVIPEEYQYLG
jgi:hypothetical protein